METCKEKVDMDIEVEKKGRDKINECVEGRGQREDIVEYVGRSKERIEDQKGMKWKCEDEGKRGRDRMKRT